MDMIRLYEKEIPHSDLAIIQVLGDSASDVYTRNKVQLGEEIGIKVHHYKVEENISLEGLREVIDNVVEKHHAIILQLPLPKHLEPYEQELLDRIHYKKDVDCLSTHSIGLLHSGKAIYTPCTAQGVLDILDYYIEDLTGKNVLIVGRQNLLGYPLYRLLTDRDCTCSLAHSKTVKLQEWFESGQFDIIVTAVGKPKFFKGIKAEFIIDVGVNRDSDGKLCGDVDIDTCDFEYASTLGKGLGGVGQLTVKNLIKNSIIASNIE